MTNTPVRRSDDLIKNLVNVERDRERVISDLGTALMDAEDRNIALETEIRNMTARHDEELGRLGELHGQLKRQYEDTFLELRTGANAAEKKAAEAAINAEHWFGQCKVLQARSEEAVENLATDFEDFFAKFRFAMTRLRAEPIESVSVAAKTVDTLLGDIESTVKQLSVVRNGPDTNPERTKEERRGLAKSSA